MSQNSGWMMLRKVQRNGYSLASKGFVLVIVVLFALGILWAIHG